MQKEAGRFCRTSFSVRLCWELEEPKRPQGLGRLIIFTPKVDGFPLKTWGVEFRSHQNGEWTSGLILLMRPNRSETELEFDSWHDSDGKNV